MLLCYRNTLTLQQILQMKPALDHTVLTYGPSRRRSGPVACVERGLEVQELFATTSARSTWRSRRRDVDSAVKLSAGLDKWRDTSAFITQNRCN